MDAVTLLLRFMFGTALAGTVVVLGGIPFPAGVISVVLVGIAAVIWGDKFLLWFMSAMRYLR